VDSLEPAQGQGGQECNKGTDDQETGVHTPVQDKVQQDCENVSTNKEPYCPYGLLNILFSDPFAEGFSQRGNVAAWAKLDSGKAANNQLFWEGVQEAFHGQDPATNNSNFADDKVLLELHYINFKK